MSVKILAKNDESLKSVLHDTALFKNLSEEEIQSCLVCSKAESIYYEKGEMIFSEEDHFAFADQRFRYPWNGLFRREKKYHRYV